MGQADFFAALFELWAGVVHFLAHRSLASMQLSTHFLTDFGYPDPSLVEL